MTLIDATPERRALRIAFSKAISGVRTWKATDDALFVLLADCITPSYYRWEIVCCNRMIDTHGYTLLSMKPETEEIEWEFENMQVATPHLGGQQGIEKIVYVAMSNGGASRQKCHWGVAIFCAVGVVLFSENNASTILPSSVLSLDRLALRGFSWNLCGFSFGKVVSMIDVLLDWDFFMFNEIVIDDDVVGLDFKSFTNHAIYVGQIWNGTCCVLVINAELLSRSTVVDFSPCAFSVILSMACSQWALVMCCFYLPCSGRQFKSFGCVRDGCEFGLQQA